MIEQNKVYCMDCLELMKQMPDKSVDLIITDPPYNINVQSKNCAASRKDNRQDDKVMWDNDFLIQDYLKEMIRISNNQIIFGANYHNCFSIKGGAIIWDKLQPLPDSSQCEIASTSTHRKVFKYTQRWTNFVNTKKTQHPTEKPVSLGLWILSTFAKEGDIIFDPFAGSGSFIIAAKQKGFKWIACEINPEYCKIVEERLKQSNLFSVDSSVKERMK